MASGADGKSAYQYAQDGGYTGTETEFAEKLAEEIPTVDDTLTQSGQAADASVVGNRLSALSEEIVTTSESKVAAHNTGTDTHSDIRLLIQGLTDRLNALADSDDTTLDQLSEVAAYIKSNRSLIEAITTSKVSVADIVDNLTTNVSNKPLSAAQGVVIKTLIDALRNDKLDAAELTNAVNTALAQAKASGEFDGADGHTPVKGTDYWTSADKAEVVAEAAAAIDLTSYAKKTEVPTKTSQITNDSGFLTSHQDISGKQDKATLEADVAAKGFTKNAGTYSKPAGGIPKSDLAAAVQTSIGKADTALQEHQSLAAYRTAAAQDVIDSGKVDKVTGKGLSTNDYTASAKAKVDAIPANPKYTDTVYDDTALKERVATIEGKESAWDAKLNASELPTAINTALAQAKASGEFDGANGVGIQSVEQTTTSTEDRGVNVVTVTKTDGTTSALEVRNGSKGSAGKTAYQYAQDGGYTGTEAEFAAKLAEDIQAVDSTLTVAGAAADAAVVGNRLSAISEEKAGKNDLPTALPNPNAITINGVSYDGSSPVDVTIRGDADAVPDYVRTEAETVAANVQSTRKAGSFVLPIFTDFHIWADDAKTDESYVNTRSSVVLAGQALSELRQRIGFDAAAMLGDYTWGGKPYTAEQIMADITYVKRAFADGLKGVTTSWLTGNHDINYPANRDRIVTADEQYAYIAANAPELVRDPDNLAGNYGYLDFQNQRIRLVCLNTTDVMEEFPDVDGADHTSENIGEKQAKWFATKALDFSDKSDASAWGIVILSHHPISIFLNRGFILKLLEAYKNGESGSVTANFTPYSGYPAVNYTIDYDYTSGDKAQILCNIHGHVHNCGYGYMSSADDVTPWMLRLCIPQVCYTRNNEAATSTDTNYAQKYGEFGSDGNPVYYQKTAGTAQGTSFCVVDINKADRIVHAYIYGAGIDRSLGIDPASYTVTFVTNGGNTVASQTVSSGGKATAPTTPTKDGYTFVGWYSDSGLENAYDFNTVVTGDITLYAKWEEVQIVSYSVTNNLTNVVTSNIISTVNEGESYSATLSANSGYELNSVAVSMGGIDITSTTYSNGLVSISSVTGDIVITASAELIATYTNRIRTAVSDAGGTVYGTNGYIVDTYASSSGLATGAASGYVSTGAMPVPDPNATTLTVYIKGGTFDGTRQCRLYPYDSTLTRQGGITKITDGTSSGFVTLVTKLADEYYKVDLKWNYHGAGVYHYFRFSIKCNAEDAPNLICTFNEPID